MLQQWALHMVIVFVVGRIAKFGSQIKWAMVHQDFHQWIDKMVPWTWLEEPLSAFADAVIDACAKAVADTVDLQKIIELASAKKWAEAAEALKDLVLAIYKPTSEDGQKLMALLLGELPEAAEALGQVVASVSEPEVA